MFMKTHPVELQLIFAGGRTERQTRRNQEYIFKIFANAPKNVSGQNCRPALRLNVILYANF
jgi:hypothetical protein